MTPNPVNPKSKPVNEWPRPPLRHGSDVTTTRRIARQLRWTLRGDIEPDPQTWAELGSALWDGDPLADEVAAWLLREGMAAGRPILERAIEGGLDAAPDAPEALQRFIRETEQVPAWVDPELMRAGARFVQSTGLHGMMVLRDAGLMAGYQAGAINQTLVMTGALQKGVQRRIAETTSWWMDCTADDGMSRQGRGFKSTLRVRVMHALVRASVRSRPGWNADLLGLPINQVDMQATYLGFSVVHLLALRATGVMVREQDARAVVHLWRYIGWLMGVQPRWLYDDEMAARIGLYHNVVSQAPPDASSVALGRALMDEPLQRHYPWGGALRGRFNKARHLSLVRLFVGREGMQHLGLPPSSVWYPALTLLPRLCWTASHRLWPGGMSRLALRGRAAQEAYLPIMFGGRKPGVAAPTAALKAEQDAMADDRAH